ncbi:MAG: energy transducer TonB [Candidatus Kapabacteria bacterium]|nr:energy transducer TonB [Candidatus Kapabacteria bacterium]
MCSSCSVTGVEEFRGARGMSARRLIARIALWSCALLLAVSAGTAQRTDDPFIVYARSAHSEVKLVRYITDFPGAFPQSMMRAMDLSMVFVRRGTENKVVAARPSLPQPTLDSIAEWLVPFNPMSVDTFAIAMRVMPLRKAISEKSKLLGSPHSRLVSQSPWFRKGVTAADTAGGRRRPGLNGFTVAYDEPKYNADTLGSYVIYPPVARGRGIKATVTLTAFVNVNGFVDDLVVLESTNEMFDLAAARAVRCLRFVPGVYKGAPTAMWVTIPITFSPN